MVVNVLIHPTVNVVNLAFDTVEHLQVLAMLFGISFIKPLHCHDHWSGNEGDNNRYPPHGLHPTLPYGFGLDSGLGCLSLLLALTLADGGSMEIFLAVGEAQADALHMATEAQCPASRHDIKGEQIVTFGAVDRTHHHYLSALPTDSGVICADWHPFERFFLTNKKLLEPIQAVFGRGDLGPVFWKPHIFQHLPADCQRHHPVIVG